MDYNEKMQMLGDLLNDLAENHFSEFSKEFHVDVFARPEFDDISRFWVTNGIVDAMRDMGMGLSARDMLEENLRIRSGYKTVTEKIADLDDDPEPGKCR